MNNHHQLPSRDLAGEALQSIRFCLRITSNLVSPVCFQPLLISCSHRVHLLFRALPQANSSLSLLPYTFFQEKRPMLECPVSSLNSFLPELWTCRPLPRLLITSLFYPTDFPSAYSQTAQSDLSLLHTQKSLELGVCSSPWKFWVQDTGKRQNGSWHRWLLVNIAVELMAPQK